MNNFTFEINKSKILEIKFKNNNKNSFSPTASDELNKILFKENGNYKAILFSSDNPNFFCVGGDLKYYSQLETVEPGLLANKKIAEQLNELNTLGVPTAVIVDGLCIGGGVELITAFDFVISSPASLFAFWQRKIGLSFGWGGGLRLLERMTKSQIKKSLIKTELISSFEALDINLIDHIVPKNRLYLKAISILEKSVSLPEAPVEQLKKINYFKDEELSFANLWLKDEHIEALNLFNKK